MSNTVVRKRFIPKYVTQGGGLAVLRGDGYGYVFIKKPDCPGLDIGDEVPIDWGIEGPFDENWQLID